jgi:predicted alpha/beta superfamily hydrolase
MHSTIADSDYQISVALPYHYDDDPDKVWPVIYVLDSNLYFGLVVDMVRAMNIRVEDCDELPDAFIVGVGYPVEGSLSTILHEVMHRRMRDFLPGRDRDAEDFIQQHFPVTHPASAGKAAAFWGFLHEELIPLVESEYRADPGDRTLLGHSWGATFALYTLFRDPHVFHRYVIASSGPNFEFEADYAREHDRLPVRLHWVMEESESEVATLERFLDTLTSRRYAGLEVSHQVLNCTHCAIVAPAFQAGLVSVFF